MSIPGHLIVAGIVLVLAALGWMWVKADLIRAELEEDDEQ